MIFELFVAVLAVMVVSLAGVVTTWKVFGEWVTKHLHYLTSFAAGVFIVVAFGLAQEAFEIGNPSTVFAYILGGGITFLLLGKLLPEAHHHHDPHDGDHGHSKASGQRIMMADAVHNVADGIILVPAFAVSFELGIAVAIGIVIHEAVQEISEFFVLKDAGYTTKEALTRNFLVSSTIIIGAIIGLMLNGMPGIEPILLALSSGAFFYVVFVDLLPQSLKVCRSRFCVTKHVVWAIIGLLAMVGVNAVTGDTHIHGDGSQHAEYEDEHDDHGHEEDTKDHEHNHVHDDQDHHDD